MPAAAVAATMLHLFVTHLDYRWEFSAVVIRPSLLPPPPSACEGTSLRNKHLYIERGEDIIHDLRFRNKSEIVVEMV